MKTAADAPPVYGLMAEFDNPTALVIAARRTHEEGWAFFLGNLKTYLERGEDGRPAALGMQTAAA